MFVQQMNDLPLEIQNIIYKYKWLQNIKEVNKEYYKMTYLTYSNKCCYDLQGIQLKEYTCITSYIIGDNYKGKRIYEYAYETFVYCIKYGKNSIELNFRSLSDNNIITMLLPKSYCYSGSCTGRLALDCDDIFYAIRYGNCLSKIYSFITSKPTNYNIPSAKPQRRMAM